MAKSPQRVKCQQCSGPLGEADKSVCSRCKAKLRERRAFRNAQKLCTACGEPRGERGSRTLCDKCAESTSTRHARRYEARKRNGLCTSCGKQARAGYSLCEKCNARKRAGSSEKYNKRTKEGLCFQCGEKGIARAGNRLRCWRCWLMSVSVNNLGTSSRWQDIERKWHEQDGKCAYTGEALIPGDGASLDHIVPISAGGTHDYDNLQWVHKRVNVAKNDMLEDEFLDIIYKIAAYKGKK